MQTLDVWISESGRLNEYREAMSNPVVQRVLEMVADESRPSLEFAMKAELTNDFKLGYVSGMADVLKRLQDIMIPDVIYSDIPSTYLDEPILEEGQ